MISVHKVQNPVLWRSKPCHIGQALMWKAVEVFPKLCGETCVRELLGHLAIDISAITEYMNDVQYESIYEQRGYELMDCMICIDHVGWTHLFTLRRNDGLEQPIKVSGTPPIAEDTAMVWLYPVVHEPNIGLGIVWEEITKDAAQAIYEKWESFSE